MFGFDAGVVLICAAVLLLLIAAAVFWLAKKPRGDSDAGSYEKRAFTEDDRQAVLLIQELGDIINTVEKSLQ